MTDTNQPRSKFPLWVCGGVIIGVVACLFLSAAALLLHGPAPAPAPDHPIFGAVAVERQSLRVIYASRAGVPTINPSNPQAGPDGTAALQAILNQGASGPLELVIDGCYLAGNLNAYPGTTVRGLGAFTGSSPTAPAGLWQRAITNGTDSCILKNAHWRSPYQGATIVDSDITIRDLYLNGQRANGASGSSDPRWNTSLQLVCPIQVFGCTNLRVERVSIYDPCCYHTQFANINFGTFRDLQFYDPVWAASPGLVAHRNTDGLHFNGPANDLFIANLRGTPGDDLLALNAGDVNMDLSGTWSPATFGGFSAVYTGTIQRVVAHGLFPDQAYNVLRLSTGSDPGTGGGIGNIDDVIVSGVTGSAVLAGCQAGTGGGIVTTTRNGRATLRDWHLDVLPPQNETVYGFTFGGTWTDVEIENLKFATIQPNGSIAHQINMQSDGTINRLGISIKAKTNAVSPAPLILLGGGTVNKLVIHDTSWEQTSTTAVPLCSIAGATVGDIEMVGVSATNINNILSVNSNSTVANVMTSGLSHFGANGNPSISVGSGSTISRLRSGDSNTLQLQGGAGTVASKKTDATEDS